MFGKVKQWLGIEGVKLELVLPEKIEESEGRISGKLRFYSMHPQTVKRIKVKLIERYTRGRRNEKMTDDYELGHLEMDKTIDVPAEEVVELDFVLSFQTIKSDMDELEDKNFVLGRLIKTAKWIRGVNSEYRIEAEAEVKGTALNPFDKKNIHIT